jgi:hypothetical protein
MCLEIIGDFFVVAARGSQEIPGKLARPSESESHRYPSNGDPARE